LFHAAYALGIRPTELSPPRKPCPSRGRCSPAVGRHTFCLRPSFPDARLGRPRARSRRGGSPSSRASSFSTSPTTLFVPRVGRPLARPLGRAVPDPAPIASPLGLSGREWDRLGMEPSGCQASCRSVERLRSEALLLLGIRSRRPQGVPADDGRCSPGLHPSRAFPLPALGPGATPAAARRWTPVPP
jgi:hypothetical protein